MAKCRKNSLRPGIIRFFPNAALRAERLKGLIEKKKAQVKNLEEGITGEKHPGNIVDLNISLCKRRIELLKREINFFQYLLAHKGELNLEVDNEALWNAIGENNAKIKQERRSTAQWRKRDQIRLAKESD